MMLRFMDYNFGDYSGLREYKRNPEFFVRTFVEPEGLSLDQLSCRGNYLIVGHKGSGKSSCCLKIAHEKSYEGFSSTFYSFSEEFDRSDVRDAVLTQSLNLSDISTKTLFDSIQDFYDFRELWIRKVLHSISSKLAASGQRSTFVEFSQSIDLAERSISQGIGRGLQLSIPSDFWLKEVSQKLKAFREKKEMPLRDFNRVCLELFLQNHPDFKHFFFFDELNLNLADNRSDQYRVMLALVRDVVRAAATLNDLFAERRIDVSIVCCLRPEVRNRLISMDPELSKLIDSSSINLSWPWIVRRDNPIVRLLELKIHYAGASEADLREIVPSRVRDMDSSGETSFEMFFLNLTWYRPRDVIRVLKSYQATNGLRNILFERGYDQDRFLREYSRVSKIDCFAELEVKYTSSILNQVVSNIRRARYDNLGYLMRDLAVLENRVDLEELVQDLFEAGVISNHEREGDKVRVYSSFRGDSEINRELRILVHRGLWRAMQVKE